MTSNDMAKNIEGSINISSGEDRKREGQKIVGEDNVVNGCSG